MLCLEEVKEVVGRALSGKGRGWGALWLERQQALLGRWWTGCQAKIVRENNATEPIVLILSGIQVKDSQDVLCGLMLGGKIWPSSKPCLLCPSSLYPDATSPLLPKPFPPAQDLLLPGPAKFPHPKPKTHILTFSPTISHHCPFSFPRQLKTWSDHKSMERDTFQLHFKILMGSAIGRVR